MNSNTAKKNTYENFTGPASDYKNREFLQWKKSDLIETLYENEIRKNYEAKIAIIDGFDTEGNPKNIKEIKALPENDAIDTIVNKRIIREHLTKLEEIYNRREVPKERREANKIDLDAALGEYKLKNMRLHNIAKMLRGTRYNFYGIIIEEGTWGEFIYENTDGTLKLSEKEIPGEKCIIKKKDKVLIRHLEYKDIKQQTMEKALKDWVAFYQKYYKDHMQNVKYLMSWSRLWNKDFWIFYKKITGKLWKIWETRKWTEKHMGAKFITREDIRDKDENDRFIQMIWVQKDEKTEKMEEIKKRILHEKWIIGEATAGNTKKIISERKQERTQELIDKRNKDHTTKINTFHVARALYGPIPTSICIMPIEKIKKAE